MCLWSKNPLPTFLLSYLVRVTSKIQVNFRYMRCSKVLKIVSYRFLKFLHHSSFVIEESIADNPTELPCLGDLKNPHQRPIQEVLEGTDDCVS